MTTSEYKELFGLCNNARTTEPTYSAHMRELSYINDMPNRLKDAGKGTRIKPGERKMRYGKKSRLQECLERSNRYSKRNAKNSEK